MFNRIIANILYIIENKLLFKILANFLFAVVLFSIQKVSLYLGLVKIHFCWKFNNKFFHLLANIFGNLSSLGRKSLFLIFVNQDFGQYISD